VRYSATAVTIRSSRTIMEQTHTMGQEGSEEF
jgi:hypothetical protein